MRILDKELENKKIDYNKLLTYGFMKNNNSYTYKNKILDKNFEIIVEIKNKKMISRIIDLEMDEEYLLADIKSASGDFVGKVKEEYESRLQDIIDNCFVLDAFKSKQAREVIKYIKDKYNDDLEFLWKKVSNNAVFRNKSNNKWYGVLLIISKQKLGLDSDEIIDVLDLRNTKEEIKKIIDNQRFFPGYHMNKEHWFTIPLDGTVPIEEIFKYIDSSYNLK